MYTLTTVLICRRPEGFVQCTPDRRKRLDQKLRRKASFFGVSPQQTHEYKVVPYLALGMHYIC